MIQNVGIWQHIETCALFYPCVWIEGQGYLYEYSFFNNIPDIFLVAPKTYIDGLVTPILANSLGGPPTDGTFTILQ